MSSATATRPRGQPQERQRRPRSWRHAESSFTLGSGGDTFGRYLKHRALKLVRVITDDTEITIGYLIRNDEDNQIRVGHRVSVLRDPNAIGENPLNMKRRFEWRLDAISRERIRDFQILS